MTTSQANVLCNANKSAATLIEMSERANRVVRAPYDGVVAAELFQSSDDTRELIGENNEHVTEYLSRDRVDGELLWRVQLYR